MRTISSISFYLALAVMPLLFHQAASACQVDEFYLTRGGYLAASSQDNLVKAEKADQQHIKSMLESGKVLRLQQDIKVQAKERSVEYQMILIKFPDQDVPVWVREDALKRTEQ